MTDNEQFHDPAEIRHRIGANGAFNLANVSGDIKLRGDDTDEVVVIARSGHGRQDVLPIVVRRTEGALSIELDQRATLMGWFGRGRDDVEFDVTLPRAARVDVNAVSADLDTTNLTGDQTYKTVSGDVTIMRGGGRISLTTVSGDADVHADESVEADVSSTSGDIELTGPVLRQTHLRTVSGDIQVRGAFDTDAMHSVETVSGDVDVDSTAGLTVEVRKGIDLSGGPKQRVVGDGAARLRFRSLSGDLHVAGAGTDKGVKDAPSERGFPFNREFPFNAATPPMPPMPPMPPAPAAPPAPGPASAADSLDVLRALERGEIDVEEAQRRLEGARRA